MTDWFRAWHGAPTDPKWRTIARRANSRPGDVFAVVSCLWDRASQAKDRGSVAGYDCEIIADGLGYEPEEVERIIAALIDKEVIVDGRIAAWEKYQPKREDNQSTDRSRRFRDKQHSQTEMVEAQRDETQCNASQRTETLDTDTEENRGEEKEEKKEPSRAVADATRPSDGFEDFRKRYPRRDGANPWQPARKKFLGALKGGATVDEILVGVDRFAAQCAERGIVGTPYVPQAVKWLNQQQWQDYQPGAEVAGIANPAARQAEEAERIREQRRQARNGHEKTGQDQADRPANCGTGDGEEFLAEGAALR